MAIPTIPLLLSVVGIDVGVSAGKAIDISARGKRTRVKRVVKLRKIATSGELMERLDYASKVDRSASHIATLIADGELQAEQFLDDMDGREIRGER